MDFYILVYYENIYILFLPDTAQTIRLINNAVYSVLFQFEPDLFSLSGTVPVCNFLLELYRSSVCATTPYF